MSSYEVLAEKFFQGSKKKRNLCKTAIVISSIDGQVQASLYLPILALISQSFSDQMAIVNFSFSITSGCMVIFIFVAGFLARIFDKRNILIAGTLLFILGGFLGAFAPSALFLVCTRAIEGIGAGLAYPVVPAITAQLFKDEERASLLGVTNAGACAISFVLNIGAGLLGAVYGWRICLYLYAILFVSLFFQIKYIPKTGAEKNILKSHSDDEIKIRIPRMVFVMAVLFFAYEIFAGSYQMILPYHIIESGIGDSALMGTSNAINVLVGVGVGVFFGKLLKIFKRFTAPFALACGAISYVCFALADSGFLIYVGMPFLGISFGMVLPYINEYVAQITNDSNVTISMTIVSALGFLLGVFCVNFFVGFLNSVTANDYVMECTIIAVTLGLATIVFLIIAFVNKKKPELTDERVEQLATEASSEAFSEGGYAD